MRPRSLLILFPLTLLALGGGSLLDLVRARAQTTLEAEGPEINATGTGTAGRIVKWLTATNQGNSVITESAGKIGLGTTTPAAKLTVVNTLSGGTAVQGTSTSGLCQR